jgi:hypothetical protein
MYMLYFYIFKFLDGFMLITLHHREKPHQMDRKKKKIHKDHYHCALYERDKVVENLCKD